MGNILFIPLYPKPFESGKFKFTLALPPSYPQEEAKDTNPQPFTYIIAPMPGTESTGLPTVKSIQPPFVHEVVTAQDVVPPQNPTQGPQS